MANTFDIRKDHVDDEKLVSIQEQIININNITGAGDWVTGDSSLQDVIYNKEKGLKQRVDNIEGYLFGYQEVSVSSVDTTDENISLSVVLSGATFSSESDCENTANWAVVNNNTGVSIALINYVDETHCTVAFDAGWLTVGEHLTIYPKGACLTSTKDARPCTVIVEAGVHTLSTVSTIAAGAEDPTLTLALSGTIFDETGSENLDNWTFIEGNSGLRLASISYESTTELTASFTGTAVASEMLWLMGNGSVSVSGVTTTMLEFKIDAEIEE